MYRITFFLGIIAFFLLTQSVAMASEPLDFPEALKSRQVIGVIYFTTDSIKLSKTHRAELNRIASLVIAQFSPDKIVRVEGFATKRARQIDPLAASLSRAKSVWHYLEKMNSFNSSNLFMTGFDAQQSFSDLQGERVEIVIYGNPFKGKTEVYSSY
jgi:outer membrane protein OmpA-like peptidoglycan-associated protein